MTWQHTPYTLPLLATGSIAAAIALHTWRRRAVPLARTFMVLPAAVTVFAFAYALEMASADLPSKIFWNKLTYIGIVLPPFGALTLALHHSGRTAWLTRRFSRARRPVTDAAGAVQPGHRSVPEGNPCQAADATRDAGVERTRRPRGEGPRPQGQRGPRRRHRHGAPVQTLESTRVSKVELARSRRRS